MPRYIDADYLLKEISFYADRPTKSAMQTIKGLAMRPDPDVVKVIRCKDCRFYLQSNEKCELVDTRLRFYETDKTWTGECFCSWGERRKDNEQID